MDNNIVMTILAVFVGIIVGIIIMVIDVKAGLDRAKVESKSILEE